MKSSKKQSIRLTLLIVLTPLLVFNSVGQSLWKKDVSKSMYADLIANQVGDVLNVIIQEQNNNKQQANTTTAKNSSINASIQSFLYPPSASGILTKNGYKKVMDLKRGDTLWAHESVYETAVANVAMNQDEISTKVIKNWPAHVTDKA